MSGSVICVVANGNPNLLGSVILVKAWVLISFGDGSNTKRHDDIINFHLLQTSGG